MNTSSTKIYNTKGNCIAERVGRQLTHVIDPVGKEPFVLEGLTFPEEVYEGFSDFMFDFTEFSKCYVVGSYTASMFHLVRAMDAALDSCASTYAAVAVVKEESLFPDYLVFQNYITKWKGYLEYHKPYNDFSEADKYTDLIDGIHSGLLILKRIGQMQVSCTNLLKEDAQIEGWKKKLQS